MYRFNIEWQILDLFNKLSFPIITILNWGLSFLGGGEAAFLIILIIYYCFDKEKGEKIAYITATSMLLNGVFKNLFLAKRPFEYDGKAYLRSTKNENIPISLSDGATGTSFPSGHSQNAGVLYTTLFLNYQKRWIKITSILLLIIVPLTRLFLGVHFPGDVIVGLGLGILAAIALNYLYNFIEKKNFSKVYLYSITLLIFVPFLFINYNNPAASDFFKCFGLFAGFLGGCLVEKKYVNFTTNVNFFKKGMRLLICGIIVLTLKSNLKDAFTIFGDNHILDAIRYGLMTFVASGVVPFIFTRRGNFDGQTK